MIRQDIAGLIKFKLPERQSRQGLAGLVHFLWVLLFAGMAGSIRKKKLIS
jgi:hypothetical protein